MAILKQSNDAQLTYIGWYGLCKDDNAPCVNFPLFTGTENTSEYIYDNIKYIYEISDNSEGDVAYNGTIAGTSPIAKIQRGGVQAQFGELECGKCYYIILKTGNGQVEIPDFTYANRSDDDPEQDINNRITDNCVAQAAEFEFDAVTSITDELDEGYTNSDATIYDAEAHTGIITKSKGISEVTMQSNASGLEYSMDGSTWNNLGTTERTISSDFSNLQLRVKTGLQSGNYDQEITFTAEPENDAYVAISKTLNYDITVNNVELTSSKTITEEIEEGQPGSVHEVTVSYENIQTILVSSSGDVGGYLISELENSGYSQSLSISTDGKTSPLTLYVKLNGNMPATDVSTDFTITGERRNSGSDIVVTNAVTADATVSPRPQITSLSVNPTTLAVSIEFSNETNYGGNHWHYRVNKNTTDGELVVGIVMPAFNESVTLSQSDFNDAGTYMLTAFIVKGNHQPIVGSDVKTTEFVIAPNNATLQISKPNISEVLDIDETQVTHTITVTQSNNLTNLALTGTLTNWDYSEISDNKFTVKLKDSVKTTDLSNGFVDLTEETLTLSGDIGDRDTSGETTKSVDVTLNARLVDNAEFSLTGPDFTVIDVRTYGDEATEFGPYTVTFDGVTLSSTSLTNWELEFDNDGTWASSPEIDFSVITSGTTFKLRANRVMPGVDATEQLIVTPTAKSSDADDTDDPSPSTPIELDSVVNPLTASLGNPGKQNLETITSGRPVVPSKRFEITGQHIENITITEDEDDWAFSTLSPNIGDIVTITYVGDANTPGKKEGQFKISAEPVTGAELSVDEYTNDLELNVNAKSATLSATDTSLILNTITSGEESDSDTTRITGSNVSEIEITSIPSGFTVKKGLVEVNAGDTIESGTTLTVTLTDTDTPATKSGNMRITATASENSEFTTSSFKDILLRGTVNPKTAVVNKNPNSISLANINTGESSVAKSVEITSGNVSNIVISNIPSAFILKSDNNVLRNGESIGTSATISVELADTITPGTRSGSFKVTGTPDANSEFSGNNYKNVSVSGRVIGLPTTMTINPSSVNETYDEDESTTAQEITLTQSNLKKITITGGVAGGYQLSADDTTYGNTLELDQDATNFYVKLMSTETPTTVLVTFTISGEGVDTAESDPSNVNLTCIADIEALPTPTPTETPTETATPTPTETPTETPFVPTDPSKLWIGFSENGHNYPTKYSPFWEVAKKEELVLTIPFDNMATFTGFGGVAPIPGQEGGFNSATMNLMNMVYPINIANLPDGVAITDLNGLEIKGTSDAMYVELVSPLSYTSFTMVDADHKTQILDWMSSAQITYIFETIVIESETQPDVDNLTSAQLNSVFNSPSLKLYCNGVWVGDEEDTDDMVRMDINITKKSGETSTIPYSSQPSTSTIINKGKWDGATGLFTSGAVQLDTTSNHPDINEFYFTRISDNTRVKLSEGNPEGSYCQST